MKEYVLLKFKPGIALASMSITPLAVYFEKYIFADYEFAKWLIILMGLDLITGITKAVNEKRAITSYGLRRTIIKIIQYFSILILVHVLLNVIIGDVHLSVFSWIQDLTFIYLIITESISILDKEGA